MFAAVALDAVNDALGDRFPEPSGLHPAAFGGVADEPTFHQNGGKLGVPDHVKPGILHLAVHRFGAPDQTVLDVIGETPAFLTMVESF